MQNPILNTCFKMNSSFHGLFLKGILSYEDLIKMSILNYFMNDCYDVQDKNNLKLAMENIHLGYKETEKLFSKENTFLSQSKPKKTKKPKVKDLLKDYINV